MKPEHVTLAAFAALVIVLLIGIASILRVW